MPLDLSFDELVEYDTRETGITVPVKLVSGNDEVILGAKSDAGSTNCVFERKHGGKVRA